MVYCKPIGEIKNGKGYCKVCNCKKNDILTMKYFWENDFPSFQIFRNKIKVCLDCLIKSKMKLPSPLASYFYCCKENIAISSGSVIEMAQCLGAVGGYKLKEKK